MLGQGQVCTVINLTLTSDFWPNPLPHNPSAPPLFPWCSWPGPLWRPRRVDIIGTWDGGSALTSSTYGTVCTVARPLQTPPCQNAQPPKRTLPPTQYRRNSCFSLKIVIPLSKAPTLLSYPFPQDAVHEPLCCQAVPHHYIGLLITTPSASYGSKARWETLLFKTVRPGPSHQLLPPCVSRCPCLK